MDKYADAGTNDFLTGLMEQHEKMAWMLRAFLTGPRGNERCRALDGSSARSAGLTSWRLQ